VSELPDGWVSASVSMLIDLNPKNDIADDALAGFMPMSFLGKDFLDIPKFEPRQWGEIKKSYTHFADGDVLLAKITPCFENGKAGIPSGLPNGVGAGSSEYFVCRTRSQVILPKYLLAYFKTPDFLQLGESQMTGSVGHKRVPKNYLLDKQIPLAPLNEQKRIADKLDRLLAKVDACRQRCDRIPLILKRFRQSVLAAATSGELTEDWREEQGTLFNWQYTDIQSVAKVGTGSTPLRSNSSYYAELGVPWITSGATGQTFVNAATEFVTEAAISAHRLKIYPVGTLLVAMYGEGKTRGQVSELAIEATINQACAAVVVDESLAVRKYVKLVLQSNYLEMREMAEGGNQPNLNLSKIKNFPLPLPSLDEQKEIVRRVEKLFTFADRLEARYQTARAKCDQLTPAILEKAFQGELVPQDPNDEPVSVLLEKIQAEGNKTKRAAKSRKAKTPLD
jgi:type I restriction enzyme, S subunit